jgi:hypothetical protein
MSVVNSTVWEIFGFICRSRSHWRGENKAVVDINRSMLFKAIMGFIVLNYPV